jgi:hypothetical protein
MTKKSSTETKKLEDSCKEGTKKDLEGGGFTCTNKDGKTVTCIPNNDTTSNCWVSSAPPPSGVLDALVQVHKALLATEAALEEIIEPDPEY